MRNCALNLEWRWVQLYNIWKELKASHTWRSRGPIMSSPVGKRSLQHLQMFLAGTWRQKCNISSEICRLQYNSNLGKGLDCEIFYFHSCWMMHLVHRSLCSRIATLVFLSWTPEQTAIWHFSAEFVYPPQRVFTAGCQISPLYLHVLQLRLWTVCVPS